MHLSTDQTNNRCVVGDTYRRNRIFIVEVYERANGIQFEQQQKFRENKCKTKYASKEERKKNSNLCRISRTPRSLPCYS